MKKRFNTKALVWLLAIGVISFTMGLAVTANAQGGPPPPGPTPMTEDLLPPHETPADAEIVYITDTNVTTVYTESDNVALDFSGATIGVYKPKKNSRVYLQNVYTTDNIDAKPGVFIFYTAGTHCFILDSTEKSANGTFRLASGGILTPLESGHTANNHYEATLGVEGGLIYGKANKIYLLTDEENATYVHSVTETYNGVDYNLPFYYKYFCYPKKGLFGLDWTVTSDYTNTSIALARYGSMITLSNSAFASYSRSNGPFEGGNFFGLNSAFLSDSCGTLTLNNVEYNATANAVFAVYDGRVIINGGYFQAFATGAHGLYVAARGIVDVNIDNKFCDKKHKFNRNCRIPLTTVRTIDEASTTLATDTGGGTITAYNVLTESYGIRSGGVYSIGGDEGFVSVYNSKLTSYMDAGLVSAAGGYIYAENSVIQGVFAIKTRQDAANASEVVVKNSKLISKVDMDAVKSVGYITDPSEFDENADDLFEAGNLNIFVDRARQNLNTAAYCYWFGNEDGTNKYVQAPGHSGGGTVAVIFTDGCSTPIYVNNCQLRNENYLYSEANSGEAGNYMISSEYGGTANVIFQDCNKRKRWDVTCQSKETTEIVGDFNVMYQQTFDFMGMIMTADSYLNAYLENSDWTGTIVGNGAGTNITMDKCSFWNITEDTTVGTLDVANYKGIRSRKAVTIYFTTLTNALSGGTENADGSYTIGKVTYVQN